MDNEQLYGLSDEEFEQLTGFSKEQAQVAYPDLLKRNPGAKVYRDGKLTGERESYDSKPIQVLKGATAGAGQAVVSTFPTLYGLIGAGIESMGDKTFSESMFSEEGRVRQERYEGVIQERIKQANPNADEAELTEIYDDVRKHDPDYYEQTAKNFRTGLSFAARANKKINELVGEERLPSEMTGEDALYQIAGGLIPIPGSVVGKIAAKVPTAANAISRIGSTRAGNIALNVAEAATPLVINTPGASTASQVGRWGVNMGVGAGIDQGIRIAGDAPNVLDVFKEDDGTTDWMNVAAAGGATIAAAAMAYKAKYGAATKGLVEGGPSMPQQEAHNLPNAISDKQMLWGSMGDDLNRFDMYGRALGVNEKVIGNVRDTIEMNVGVHAEAGHARYISHGIRPDGTQGVPLQKFMETLDQAEAGKPGIRQAFAEYDAYRNRLFDEKRALSEVQSEVSKTNREFNNALRTNDPIKIREAQVKKRNAEAEYLARRDDTDPNLRPSLMGISTADAQRKMGGIIQRFPEVEALHTRLRNEYIALLDSARKEGMISTSRFKQLAANVKAGLTHFEDNTGVGKTWLNRSEEKFSDWWSVAKGEGGQATDFDTFRGLHDRDPRKGYINESRDKVFRPTSATGRPNDPQLRPNNPYAPLDQLAMQSSRLFHGIANNRARQVAVNAFYNAPANQGKKFVRHVRTYTDGQFNDPKVREQVNNWLSSRKGNEAFVGYWNNGEFNVYALSGSNGVVLRDALNFAPAMTVPIVNGLRKWSQNWLTGPLREAVSGLALSPGFATVAVPWEVMTTALFRDVTKYSFGPASHLLHKAFSQVLGVDSKAHKILTGAAAFVDIPYMLGRATLTFPKRGVLAMYGDTSLQRRISAQGAKFQAQLRTNSGVFGTLAQMPGGNAILSAVANTMAKGYETSWYNQMLKAGIGHTNNLASLDNILKTADKAGYGKLHGYARASWERWRSMVSAMHDTSKELFYSHNMRRLEAAYNNAVPKEDVLALGNAARKAAGDFQRRSSVQSVNGVLSAIRYGNVIVQSTRYMGKAIKRDPLGSMSRIAIGVVMPKIMTDYYITNHSQEARDYFWNRTTESRIGTVFLPRPDAFIKETSSGKKLPFDPRNWIEIRIAPEIGPIMSAMSNGLLAMGLIPSNVQKGAPVPIDISGEFGAVVNQAFGVTTPLGLGTVMKGAGYDMRPGNVLVGDPVLRPLHEPVLQGANVDKMSPGSDMPRWVADVITDLFGVSAGAMLEGLNVGMETKERTKSVWEGIKAGTATTRIKTLAGSPYSSTLYPEYSRRFIYTPQAQEVGKFVHTLHKGIEDQWKVEIENRKMRGDNAAIQIADEEPAAAIGKSLTDPLLIDLMHDIHATFLLPSSEFYKMGQERSRLKATHEALLRGTGTDEHGKLVSPAKRYTLARQKALEVNAIDTTRYHSYKEEWSEIVKEYGTTFAKAYGGSLTPENFLKAIQKNARDASLAEVVPP